MPVWEKATITTDGRVEVDAGGDDYVKFLAPQFRKNDGDDYGTVGFGVDVIGEASAPSGGGGEALPYFTIIFR